MGTAKLMPNFAAVYSSDDEGKIPIDHKRMAHNQIERRRKVKINNWIYRLGSLLPGVNKDKKPSKNLILEKAVEYIKELRDTNEQLLLGHTSDVQAREFQQMKSRIEQLETRNTELTRYVESSGLWHQHAKYSNKIDPDSIVLPSCDEKLLISNTTSKREPETMQSNCALSTVKMSPTIATSIATSSPTINNRLPSTSQFVVQNGVVLLQNGDTPPKIEAVKQSCQNETIIRSSETTVVQPEFVVQANLLNNSNVTAVTQALPSIPIMSTTSQQTSGNQQVLQQLPVLNYGNTVNIFPGLVGQGQPMIIINDQGVPLLQSMLPGQLLLNSSNPTPCCNTTNSPVLNPGSNIPVTAFQTSTSMGDFSTNPPTMLINSLSGQAISSASTGGHFLVNTGLNQPAETCNVSGQARVMVKPTRPCIVNKLNNTVVQGFTNNDLNSNNQLIFSTSNPNINPKDKMNAVRPQLLMSPQGKPAQPLTLTCVNGQGGTDGSILQSTNCTNLNMAPNAVSFSSPGDNLGLGNASISLKSCGGNTVLVNSAPQCTMNPGIMPTDSQQMQTLLTGQVLNRTAFVQSQPNSLQIVSQQSLQRDPNAILNQMANSSQLPSALLLPNGQLIPVVSQPSLIYPGASPITGSLLMAPPPQPQSTILQPQVHTSPAVVATPQQTKSNLKSAQNVKETIVAPKMAVSQSNSGEMNMNNVSRAASVCTTTSTTQNTPVLLPATQQNEFVKCVTSVANATCAKKAVKRSPRVIKPKPAAGCKPLVTSSHEKLTCTTIQTSNSTVKTASSNNNSSNNSNNGNKKTNSMKEQGGTPSFHVSVIGSDGSRKGTSTITTTATSKPLCIATDILAKATESIFSSSLSDPSPPISRFYNCDSADYPAQGTDSAERNENSISKKAIGNDEKEKVDEKVDGNDDQNDLLQDLVADVYAVEDRDMPLLQPISPAVRSNCQDEKCQVETDTSSEQTAPSLSAMIPDSTSLAAKRSQDESAHNFPMKRVRQDDKKEVLSRPTKDDNEFAPPPCTSSSGSVNFLSVPQLASSSFTIDTSLCNDNSPLGSISPLLVSPTKSNGSDRFLASTTSAPLINNNFDSGNDGTSTNQNCVSLVAMLEDNGPVRQSNMEKSATQESSSDFLHNSENHFGLGSPNRRDENSSSESISRLSQSDFAIDELRTSKAIISPMVTATSARTNHCFSDVNYSSSTSNNLMNTKSLSVESINMDVGNNTSNHVSSFVGSLEQMTPTPSRNSSRTPVASVSSFAGAMTSSATNTQIACNTNSLQTSSFSMPDLLQNNMPNMSSITSSVNNNNLVLQSNQEMTDSSIISNDCDNVPSFNFGFYGQTNQIQSCVSSAQTTTQMPSSTFNQSYITNNNRRQQASNSTSLSQFHNSKSKPLANRRPSGNEEMLSPTGMPIHPTGAHRPASSGNSMNLISGQPDATQQSPTPSQSVTSPVFHNRRSTVGGSNYSAEALISQGTYVHSPKNHHHHHSHSYTHVPKHAMQQSAQQQQQQQQTPQQQQQQPLSSRSIISYSAESLIQSQADRHSNCSQVNQSCLVQQSATSGMNSTIATISYSAPNTAQPLYFAAHHNPKQGNCAQSSTLMHFDVPSQKNVCATSQQQSEQLSSFSFSLRHANASNPSQTTQQNQMPHLAYPPANMFHYPQPGAGLPQVQKQVGNSFPQQLAPCVNVVPGQQQSCNTDATAFNHQLVGTQFSEQFSATNNSNNNGNNTFPDVCKLAGEKSKKQESVATNKSSNKKQNQKKKQQQQQQQQQQQHYTSVEEVNLSNSIFETNRSVTPYFGVPNLSPPRNEAPTYIPNPNGLFNSQRTLGPNGTSQNKPGAPDLGSSYNSLFPSRSQTGLNLNFQAPSFGMNHVHAGAGTMGNQMSTHGNVTNFNLSNIFPDISSSGESLNISPIKFHPGNSILSTESQHHHQSAPALYNRPVLHNGMSINSLLHNPHPSFDAARSQMPNGMPPAFHTHTPSFSNVVPTLNFAMHEH